MSNKISNAIIERADLLIERGSFMTSAIQIREDCFGQCFGGWILQLAADCTHFNPEAPYGGYWVLRCMQIAGVDCWTSMRGKAIRIARDENERIVGIGHIVKDDWFFPESVFKAIRSGLEMPTRASNPGTGAGAIAAERQRQVEEEGYTADHDDLHSKGELAQAGAAYALGRLDLWPRDWEPELFKTCRKRQALVKAGAFIAAEIDRIDRADAAERSKGKAQP